MMMMVVAVSAGDVLLLFLAADDVVVAVSAGDVLLLFQLLMMFLLQFQLVMRCCCFSW